MKNVALSFLINLFIEINLLNDKSIKIKVDSFGLNESKDSLYLSILNGKDILQQSGFICDIDIPERVKFYEDNGYNKELLNSLFNIPLSSIKSFSVSNSDIEVDDHLNLLP